MFGWRIAGGVTVAAAAACMVVVAYLSIVFPPVALILGAGAAFAFLAFSRPFEAVLITFFTAPFEYLTVLFPADSYGSGGPLNFITVVKLMLGSVVAAGALRILVSKDERFLRNLWITPIPVLVLTFYTMCWMSLANARRLPAFVVNMVSIGAGITAFFVLINLIATRRRLYAFLKVVFFSYILISMMGMFEAITKEHILKLAGRPMIERPWTQNKEAFRVAGPSGDPDYYAISVIFGLMITFAVLPLGKSRRWRLGVMAVAFMHFLTVVATASRGAALSTGLALGLLYLFARFPHKLLVGVTAVVLLGAGFAVFSLTVSPRAAARYSGGDTTSWEERLGWVQMCADMTADAPFRGVGSGQFVVLYHRYADSHLVPRKEPESAQNTYAQMSAQNGIPTTLVYALANLVLWALLWHVMWRTRDPILRHVTVSFFALALSFWFFSLTLDLIETEIGWILFATGVVLWRIHARDVSESVPAPRPRRVPFGWPEPARQA